MRYVSSFRSCAPVLALCALSACGIRLQLIAGPGSDTGTRTTSPIPVLGGWLTPALSTSVSGAHTNYSFTWEQATDAGGPGLALSSTYKVETFANGTCSGTPVASSLQALTSFSYAGLSPGSPYSLRLTAFDSAGAASESDCSPALAVRALSTFLYSFDGADQQFGYKLDPSTGGLTAIAGSPFTGTSVPLINVQDTRLRPGSAPISYLIGGTAFPDFGVFSWLLDPTLGTLSNATGSPLTALGSNSQTFLEPQGRFFYAMDTNSAHLASVAIRGFKVNTSTGAILEIAGSPFAAPFTPDSVDFTNGLAAFDSAGKFAYFAVFDSVGSAAYLAGYAIDQTTGALTALTPATYTLLGATDSLFVDPSGGVLFVGHVGAIDQLESFLIDPATGALTHVGDYSLGTTGAVNWSFDAVGTHLYLGDTGANANTIGYTLNPATGTLTAIAGSPFAVDIANAIDRSNQLVCTTTHTQVSLAKIQADHSLSIAVGATAALATSNPVCIFSPQGNYFYVVDNVNPAILNGFSYDPTTTAITALGAGLGFPVTLGAFFQSTILFDTAP